MHVGAGDFVSDIITISLSPRVLDDPPETFIWTHTDTPTEFTPRGWMAAAALSERTALVFGGLADNDENPLRLNDTWLIELVE